jgi:hypothetical protein
VESVEVPGFDRSKFQLASPRDDKAITDLGVHVGQIDGAKYVIQRTDGLEVSYTSIEYPIVRARSKQNRGQRHTLWGIPRGPTPRFFNNPMDRVSAETGMLTSKVLACAAAKGSPNAQKKKRTRMMFSGRAVAAKANILFNTGASANFVSKTFAKQTGITVRPVEYYVRLADDKTTEVAGEATLYVQLEAFHKLVKCYVMDMLYEVDLILGEEFLDKYDCILHYGKGCIMIRRGKRHMTVNSVALPRNQLPVDDEKFDSVLSASQVKRLARKGARCSWR